MVRRLRSLPSSAGHWEVRQIRRIFPASTFSFDIRLKFFRLVKRSWLNQHLVESLPSDWVKLGSDVYIASISLFNYEQNDRKAIQTRSTESIVASVISSLITFNTAHKSLPKFENSSSSSSNFLTSLLGLFLRVVSTTAQERPPLEARASLSTTINMRYGWEW